MKRLHISRSALAALGAAAMTLAGCGSSTAPADSVIQLGILQLGGAPSPLDTVAGSDTAGAISGTVTWNPAPISGMIYASQPIEAPDTVQVGQPVTIIVHTVLRDGCWQAAGETVKQSGLLVEITPEDRNNRVPTMLCSDVFGFSAHRVTVTFSSAGLARIHANGRRVAAGDGTTIQTVTAERTIVVR